MVDKVLAQDEVRPLLAEFEDEGRTQRFRCRPNGVIECLDCRHENNADAMPLLALYRVDGPDQEGEEVVTVLRCAACDQEGYLVFAQGPASSRDDAVCLAELCSDQ